MRTRTISAIIALPVFIVPILLGGPALYGLIVAATCLGLFEFNRAFSIKSKVIYTLQIFSSLVLYGVMWIEKSGFYFSAGVFLFVMLFVFYVLSFPKIKLETVFFSLIAFYYVAVMLSHVILLRNYGEMGQIFIWLIFIIASVRIRFIIFIFI